LAGSGDGSGLETQAGDAKLAPGAHLRRGDFEIGDILELPFGDGTFDVTLSTYDVCPLTDPHDHTHV
jgi:hypothetical protein